jgi:hypothetical protein
MIAVKTHSACISSFPLSCFLGSRRPWGGRGRFRFSSILGATTSVGATDVSACLFAVVSACYYKHQIYGYHVRPYFLLPLLQCSLLPFVWFEEVLAKLGFQVDL